LDLPHSAKEKLSNADRFRLCRFGKIRQFGPLP
jgi:hypothetical protein